MAKAEHNTERERPTRLVTFTVEVKTGCGTAYCTATPYAPGEYFEIKGLLGKTGNCSAAFLDALSRMVTVAINLGYDPKEVVRSLREIRCPNDSKFLKSCPAALARTIKEAIGKEWGGDHGTSTSTEKSSCETKIEI
jgi:hypothetical protein